MLILFQRMSDTTDSAEKLSGWSRYKGIFSICSKETGLTRLSAEKSNLPSTNEGSSTAAEQSTHDHNAETGGTSTEEAVAILVDDADIVERHTCQDILNKWMFNLVSL